jgi:hypothetical protein
MGTTDDGGRAGMVPREEFFDMAMIAGCEEAERRGWLAAAPWRNAWWLRGTSEARGAALRLLLDEGEALQWRCPVNGGGVWLGFSVGGVAQVRASSWLAPSVVVAAAVLPWADLKDVALDSPPGTWLHWYDVRRMIAGAPKTAAAAVEAGALGVWELEDGSALIGRVHEIEAGRVVAATAGPKRDSTDIMRVKRGGRGWVWAERWRMAALHHATEKGFHFKSVDSAFWFVLHKRRAMVKAGIIPADEGATPHAKVGRQKTLSNLSGLA